MANIRWRQTLCYSKRGPDDQHAGSSYAFSPGPESLAWTIGFGLTSLAEGLPEDGRESSAICKTPSRSGVLLSVGFRNLFLDPNGSSLVVHNVGNTFPLGPLLQLELSGFLLGKPAHSV